MREFDEESIARLRGIFDVRKADRIEPEGLRPASVLVPLVNRGDGWSMVFSLRSDDLPVHGGQISFPGGALEEGEIPEQAAIRETEEEVGISRDGIELIGRLDDLIARTGFVVTPFVGVIQPQDEYKIQPTEVVEVFEAPMSVLLHPDNPEIRYLEYRKKTYPIYFYRHEAYEIWGITGRILKSFLDLARLTV